MLRYKLRTLLILLAILPPLLWLGWTKYEAWRAEQRREEAERNLRLKREESARLDAAFEAALEAGEARLRKELQEGRWSMGPIRTESSDPAVAAPLSRP